MFGPVHCNYSFPVLQDKLKEIGSSKNKNKKLKEIVFFHRFWVNSFNLIVCLYSSPPSSHAFVVCSSTNEKIFIQNNNNNNNILLDDWFFIGGHRLVLFLCIRMDPLRCWSDSWKLFDMYPYLNELNARKHWTQ